MAEVVVANTKIDPTTAPPAGDKEDHKDSDFSLPNGETAKKLTDEQRSQSSSGASAAGNGGVGGKKKRKHRRGRRRRWKPYHKLSYEEKRQLEEREQRRAERSRANNFAHGRAMAPYNTTQFILEDREARNLEPDMETLIESLQRRSQSRERTYSGTGSWDSSGSETGSMDGSDSMSIEREFEAEYENAHAERLEAMSKEELIRDYVAMEDQLQQSMEERRDLNERFERLRHENRQLRKLMSEAGLVPRPASAPLVPSLASPDRPSASPLPQNLSTDANS